MFNNVPISVDGIQNPYKQFTLTIPNQGQEQIFYNFDFFRILTLAVPTGVTIRFGQSGTETDVVGAGIGYKLPAAVNVATIRNNSGGSVTITVALAMGIIYDDRLNVSGNINVARPSGFVSIANNALSTTAEEILAADSTRYEAIITNLDSSIEIYVGDSAVNNTTEKGIVLGPTQTLILTTTGAIYAVAASGTPSVSIAYTTA